MSWILLLVALLSGTFLVSELSFLLTEYFACKNLQLPFKGLRIITSWFIILALAMFIALAVRKIPLFSKIIRWYKEVTRTIFS